MKDLFFQQVQEKLLHPFFQERSQKSHLQQVGFLVKKDKLLLYIENPNL